MHEAFSASEDVRPQVLLNTAQARINSANFLAPSGNIYLVL